MSDINLVARYEALNPILRTVNFDSNGGSTVESQEIEHGFLAKKPADPMKPGYKFVGWYQEGWKIPFGFAYETIMKDTVLVAQWEKQEREIYKVHLDLNDGRDVLNTNSENLLDLEMFHKPIRDGYQFLGWYLKGTDILFNVATDSITKDTHLEARWKEEVKEQTVMPENKIENGGIKTVDTGVEDNVPYYMALASLSIFILIKSRKQNVVK